MEVRSPYDQKVREDGVEAPAGLGQVGDVLGLKIGGYAKQHQVGCRYKAGHGLRLWASCDLGLGRPGDEASACTHTLYTCNYSSNYSQ